MGDEQGGTPWLGEAAVPGAQPCPRPSSCALPGRWLRPSSAVWRGGQRSSKQAVAMAVMTASAQQIQSGGCYLRERLPGLRLRVSCLGGLRKTGIS